MSLGRQLRDAAIGLGVAAVILAIAVPLINKQSREDEVRRAQRVAEYQAQEQRWDSYYKRITTVDMSYEVRSSNGSSYTGVRYLKQPYPTPEELENILGHPDKREPSASFTGGLMLTWFANRLTQEVGHLSATSYREALFASDQGTYRLAKLMFVSYLTDYPRRTVSVIGRHPSDFEAAQEDIIHK